MSRCIGCNDRPNTSDRAYCPACLAERHTERRLGAPKWLVLEQLRIAYGDRCVCCGATERLEVDHIRGDGKRHRGELGSTNFYKWLRDNNFPTGFQRLCRSCNASKSTGTTCRIHQKYLAAGS